jgi:DNA-directed RNA polymerase specialized sigma24 family protein
MTNARASVARPEPTAPVCEAGDSRSASPHAWLLASIPGWPRVWEATAGRIHRWRVPPHWCVRDWWEEIDAEIIAAACQAVRAFDPARGASLSRYAYHQILAKAMARYRKEWTFGLRSGPGWTGIEPPTKTGNGALEDEAKARVLLGVTRLRDPDRRLLECLFWEGRSEEEIAEPLGITKQAVNKRKWRILLALRRSIGKS